MQTLLSPRDLLLAALVPLTWGVGFTIAKAGLEEFPPVFLMGLRFCLAAAVLVWFVPIPRGYLLKVFWIAMVGFCLQYGLTFTGLSMIDASLAVIVMQLEVPFAVLIAAFVFREQPGWQRLTGMLIAFAGVALIAGQPTLKGQLFAVFLTGSGAMIWAIGQVMVKQLAGAVAPLSLIAWIGCFAGPQMLLGSFLIETGQLDALRSASWVGWGSVVYLGIVMTAIGYGIWYRVLSKHSITQVMPVLLLTPVFTIMTSIGFLGEQPSVAVLAGGAIVIGGVAMIVFSRASPTSSTSGT